MSNPKIRYGADNYTFDGIVRPNYPYNSGIEYYGEVLQNPEYGLTNRELPTATVSWSISGIKQTARDLIWTLWATTLNRGNYLFTLIDNKKRFLFDVFWPQWKEGWKKQKGGVYTEQLDLTSPYPWTPPMFAFYPFWNGYACHSLDTNSLLVPGASGETISRVLYLSGQLAGHAAAKTGLSWYQHSSLSLIAQFATGEIAVDCEIEILKLVSGSNEIKIYARNSIEGSSSSLGLSSSQGLSSSSSAGLSSSSIGLSSSSAGLSSSQGLSSSSIGLSSSQGVSSSSGAVSSRGLSSSSLGLSSSSAGLSSSSSSSLGLSSSSIGLSSSSSVGLSSSGGDSSYSSASTSSSMGLSSSSAGLSSSSAGRSSTSSSSSEQGSAQMRIGIAWTKSGYAEESIEMDNINAESNGSPAWYDICGAFDNVNNQFHLYICRAGDSTKIWSYTMNFLNGTTSLLGIPENSIISDTSPTNYPEDITWTGLYLINSDQDNHYVDGAKTARLKYAMVVDEFVPPTEFNWIRRLFHSWNKTGGDLPK